MENKWATKIGDALCCHDIFPETSFKRQQKTFFFFFYIYSHLHIRDKRKQNLCVVQNGPEISPRTFGCF